jgi:ABC-type transporter Mla subunit MlaD
LSPDKDAPPITWSEVRAVLVTVLFIVALFFLAAWLHQGGSLCDQTYKNCGGTP